jgi:prepilin peptidase CpaA
MIEFWLLLVPFALVIVAAIHDLVRRSIPDWISLTLLTWALATAVAGRHPEGWLSLLGGFALAFVVSLVLYSARAFGGGDVKLLTALGAVLGLSMFVVLLISTAVAGCFLGLIALVRKERGFAYVPAIAVGFLIVLLWLGILSRR